MEQVLWFGWFRADIIAEYSTLFWRGLLTTIGLTVVCIVQGALLGLLLGMARLAQARHSPARELCTYGLRWPATVYVSFFRGTPLFYRKPLIIAFCQFVPRDALAEFDPAIVLIQDRLKGPIKFCNRQLFRATGSDHRCTVFARNASFFVHYYTKK